MSYSKYPYMEFSGALQQLTTPHIRKTNEVSKAVNADFTRVIGGFVRRLGSQKYDVTNYPTIPTAPIDKPTLGGFVARYATGAELWHAANISDDSSAKIRRWNGSSWVDVNTLLPASAEYNFTYDLDEVWVSNYLSSTDTVGTPFTVDSSHSVSTSRQLQFGPFGRFYMEFNGTMWAANCTVGGVRYRDRLYKSSGPTGVVATSRSAQTDVAASVVLIDNVPTMTSDSTPTGVAYASAEPFGAPLLAYSAFDDTNTSRWGTNSLPGYVAYDFGSGNAKTITAYSIVGLGTNDPTTGVEPKTWTFEGSNNNSTWTTINTQTAVAAFTQFEKRIYPVTNTTAYRYYRLNISANQAGSGNTVVTEFELLTSTSNVNALTLNVDSARYLKPTMALDVYKAGTNTKLFPLTVLDVDKINDSITFLPYTLSFATTDVNTTTDVITLSSTTNFPTGTSIRFNTTSGLPAPLVAGTVYYAINTSSTTIKLATSLTNAQTGVAIDLTTTGTGVHYIYLSYVIGNRDELWGSGRKGLLTRYWNTDYRNPEDADWLKLPATLDATNDILAVGKISSRMFMWTENAMFKYDGQNLTPLYNDIGCISMKTVCYYMSFMVWLDAKGQIWARNEEAGTQDVISTPIQKTIALVAQSTLPAASAVCVGKKLKMTLGQVTFSDGSVKTLRVIYDFEANTWTTEWFTAQMPVQLEYKYSGTIKPHWFDEHSNFTVDELGDDDSGVIIPLDVEIGDDNLQVDEVKSFAGIKVYGQNCKATKILASVDYGEWKEVGEMQNEIEAIAFPNKGQNRLPNGTMINLRFTNSAPGTAAEIHKALVYYNREEDTLRATK